MLGYTVHTHRKGPDGRDYHNYREGEVALKKPYFDCQKPFRAASSERPFLLCIETKSRRNGLEIKVAISDGIEGRKMSRLFPREFTLKNGKELIVREAREKDAKGLLVFTQEILREDEFYITTLEDLSEELTLERMEERIQKHLNEANWCYLVAVLEDHIVGQVHLWNGHRKRIEHVCQLAINVLKEYRGLGVGTALMKSAIAWAQDNAVIEKLAFGVFADNKTALRLYRKMGFVKEGRKVKEVKFGPGKYKDCILMYRFVK